MMGCRFTEMIRLAVILIIVQWINFSLCQLVQHRLDGANCKGNVHCASKCCFIKRGENEGICVTPPAGTHAICGEQVDGASTHLQLMLQNYLQKGNPQPNNQLIIGADQRRQFVTQGQPYGFGGFPGQLVTTASQGTTVTGAFVYVCSTCDTKCCCGTTCCDANVCTTVGTAAAAAITGTLCTGCNSLCCCGAQCCAASYCGLPNIPQPPMPTIPAGPGTGVGPLIPQPPPIAIPPPPAGPPADPDALAFMYMTQMAPPGSGYGLGPTPQAGFAGAMQQGAFAGLGTYPYFSNSLNVPPPSQPLFAANPLSGASFYGSNTYGPLFFAGSTQPGFGTGMFRRKNHKRGKRRAGRGGHRRWGCSSCCPSCGRLVPGPMGPPIGPPMPPPMPFPIPPPPPFPICSNCACGCCQRQCCICGPPPPPVFIPPPSMPAPGPPIMIGACMSCQCGCCNGQCCVCGAMPAIPAPIPPPPPPMPILPPFCSNCLCGCCTYQCCQCPARYPNILPLPPLAPRYPMLPPFPAYGSVYVAVPMGPPPGPASSGCMIECSCGCCGTTCCTCKDSLDSALDDARNEVQKAREEAKLIDTSPL